MPAASNVLGFDANADLHRRAPGDVYGGLDRHHVTDKDRLDEGHLIHRGRDRETSAVLGGREPGRRVHELHDRPAVHVPGEVCVGDAHLLGESDL